MKLYKYLLIIFSISILTIVGCDDFLDRPPLTQENDETAWTNEQNVRLYANKYYPTFFVGYGSAWANTASPINGFTFSDDVVHNGN